MLIGEGAVGLALEPVGTLPFLDPEEEDGALGLAPEEDADPEEEEEEEDGAPVLAPAVPDETVDPEEEEEEADIVAPALAPLVPGLDGAKSLAPPVAV